jgi:hypothetical protein
VAAPTLRDTRSTSADFIVDPISIRRVYHAQGFS